MNINITLSEALDRASARLRKKMLHSVGLLQKAEKLALSYDAEQGYYLAFSGGKDSQALYHMAQLAGVKFQGHMNLTSVDPPEVIRFIKQNYPKVELIKPKKSIFQIAIERKILPTMRFRWCCEEYKEMAGAGKVTLIGIRKAESARRAKRNEVEISSRKFSGDLEALEAYRQEQRAKRARRQSKKNGVNITNADEEKTLGCIHGKESLLISPIIHWTEQNVWEFLNEVVSVPHCSLYDEGWHRIGCIVCPMSSYKQKKLEEERYPHVKRGWLRAIKKIRDGGGIQKRIYLVEHPQGLDATAKRRRTAQNANDDIQQPQQEPLAGFSPCSSSDRLNDEQEDEIAENIYDWWITGKSYKRWYAEKFQQMKLDFKEDF